MTNQPSWYSACNFQHYEKLLNGPPCRKVRKLAKHTYVSWVFKDHPDAIGIEYHETRIITLYRWGRIDVDMGGYDTATTRSRICDFSPINVWVEEGQNYISRGRPWMAKRKNPPIFLFDCYFAQFSVDQRKSPAAADGTPLVRRSVYERRLRLVHEAHERRAKRDREMLRRLKKNGAEILKRGAMQYVFGEQIMQIQEDAKLAARQVAAANVADEVAKLKETAARRLTLCIQRAIAINNLKAAQDAKVMGPLEASVREARVIDLM